MKEKEVNELKSEIDYLCENSKDYSIRKIKSEVKRIEEKYHCFIDYTRFNRLILSMTAYELKN